MNRKKSPAGKVYVSLVVAFLLAWSVGSVAQVPAIPFIKLVNPLKEIIPVTTARQFVVGSTCTGCALSLNGQAIKVYPTGAFAAEINLLPGDSSFELMATLPGAKTVIKKLFYQYTPPAPVLPVSTVDIESIQSIPGGNLVLMAGDKIQFRVKALPGSRVTSYNNTVLHELIPGPGGMPGIYQGEYVVKPADSFFAMRFPVHLVTASGESTSKLTEAVFSVLSPFSSDIALTRGRLAHLEYGLGDDRLGGAKIGYLDSMIPLKIIGKVGTDYKIRLAKNRTAYISEDLVTLMPRGSLIPSALTGRLDVYGDERYDYVTIPLGTRLPYQSFQLLNPSRIVVDIFGATNNTNWITQLGSAKEIEYVDYEQLSDDIFRVNIQLKHRQHWGQQLYFRGNTLVVKVKQQPRTLLLNKLVIAVDAGHGGSNPGGGGPTGSSEKILSLAVALKLQKLLEAEGVNVIMTRTTDRFFDNKERILFYRDSLPDLLVSVHLNSAGDPIRAGGTSSHYRYIGFRSLAVFVHKRMLELGLKEYGTVGSFNFMLNSPTEYPNVLVETLFLSNPAEEMLILDEGFQQQIAEKIVAGLKDFLANAGKE